MEQDAWHGHLISPRGSCKPFSRAALLLSVQKPAVAPHGLLHWVLTPFLSFDRSTTSSPIPPSPYLPLLNTTCQWRPPNPLSPVRLSFLSSSNPRLYPKVCRLCASIFHWLRWCRRVASFFQSDTVGTLPVISKVCIMLFVDYLLYTHRCIHTPKETQNQ